MNLSENYSAKMKTKNTFRRIFLVFLHNSLSSANQSSKLIRKITMVYYCFILVQSKELRSENSLINSDKNSEVQTMTFFTIFYFFIFNVFS